MYVQVCTHVCTYMYVWVHRAHMYVYMCVRTCAHCMYVCIYMGFPGGSDSKESARNVGEPGVIPWSGRPPGEGKGYPCVCASYTSACVRVCSDCAYMYACVCGVCTECVRGVCAVTVCKHVGVRVCVQLCTVCARVYMCMGAPCTPASSGCRCRRTATAHGPKPSGFKRRPESHSKPHDPPPVRPPWPEARLAHTMRELTVSYMYGFSTKI